MRGNDLRRFDAEGSRPDWALAAVALALGAAYAWTVSPGLPYDEPSHWATVLFYAHHWSLPVLGHPGVTYEAQMGPVAYALDAGLVRLSRAAGVSLETSLHLVRLLGALELALTVVLVGKLVRRLVSRPWAVLAALALFATNPMLLTMSASVQNDSLALLLGLLTLDLALTRLGDKPTITSAALVGAVAAVGVLTKLTDWAAVAAIAAWVVWRHRRNSFRPLLVFLATVVAVSGWWFVRNVVLYGDPTAAHGVRRTGVSFPRYHVTGVGSIRHIFEEPVTYLWLPTEYVRNEISAPAPLKAALLAATLAVLVFGAERLVRRRPELSPTGALLGSCAFLAVAAWLVTDVGYENSAPRIAYLAMPLWVGGLALLLTRLPQRVALIVAVAFALSLNAWALHELAGVQTRAFLLLSG